MDRDTQPRMVRVYQPSVERELAALERLLFGDLANLMEGAEPTAASDMPVRQPAEQPGSEGAHGDA